MYVCLCNNENKLVPLVFMLSFAVPINKLMLLLFVLSFAMPLNKLLPLY